MSKGNATTTALAVVVSLAVAGTGGYMMGKRTAPLGMQEVVAAVNGEEITKDSMYEKMIRSGGAEVLERMIDEKLVEQLSKKQNIVVTAAEVDAAIATLKERMGGDQKFSEAMQQYGLTLDDVKNDQRQRLLATKMISKDLTLDDAKLKEYFEQNISRFDKKEVNSRHILLKTEDEAKAVKEQLDKGADFNALAKQKSTDPTAQQNGGDLGFNPRGRMVPEFDKVVFAMKKGETSAPFQTQFGWHVVQVVDIKGESSTFESVKEQVRDAALQDEVQAKIQPWLAEQRSKANITNHMGDGHGHSESK